MRYTQEQLEQFKATYTLRRRRQLISIVPTVLLAFLLGASDGRHGSTFAAIPQSYLLVIALAGLAGLVLFSFRNWRCPACDRYLGKAMNPSFCSRCGVPLR